MESLSPCLSPSDHETASLFPSFDIIIIVFLACLPTFFIVFICWIFGPCEQERSFGGEVNLMVDLFFILVSVEALQSLLSRPRPQDLISGPEIRRAFIRYINYYCHDSVFRMDGHHYPGLWSR
jgi:hypothetical protein